MPAAQQCETVWCCVQLGIESGDVIHVTDKSDMPMFLD